MKPLQIIPNHNTLSESFFPGSPHQVSIFTQKLQEDDEPVVIYATNYNNQNFERVFMVPKNRCPTWQEMVELKDMFWYPNIVERR